MPPCQHDEVLTELQQEAEHRAGFNLEGGAGQGGCKQRAKYDVLLEQPRFVFI